MYIHILSTNIFSIFTEYICHIREGCYDGYCVFLHLQDFQNLFRRQFQYYLYRNTRKRKKINKTRFIIIIKIITTRNKSIRAINEYYRII